MKTESNSLPRQHAMASAAFSLIEVLVSVLISMIVFASVYLGFAQGFGIVQMARQNLRATQIIAEKTETLRLYTWDQINTSGFIPTNFVAPFYAVGQQTNSSFAYYGRMTIEPSTKTESYRDDLRLVTINVVWTNGAVPQNRQMQTFVAKHGLQHYIY